MHADIERELISQTQIAERIETLAAEIVRDHAAAGEISMVPVLTGGMIFCSDLIRKMPIAMKIGMLAVSSYPGRAVHSHGAVLTDARVGDLNGRHVVIVDDILDTGGTLKLVQSELLERGAAAVRSCVLLRKLRAGVSPMPCDYVGFDIPDEFVVGYGLDYDDYYRNLPSICTLKPAAFARRA